MLDPRRRDRVYQAPFKLLLVPIAALALASLVIALFHVFLGCPPWAEVLQLVSLAAVLLTISGLMLYGAWRPRWSKFRLLVTPIVALAGWLMVLPTAYETGRRMFVEWHQERLETVAIQLFPGAEGKASSPDVPRDLRAVGVYRIESGAGYVAFYCHYFDGVVGVLFVRAGFDPPTLGSRLLDGRLESLRPVDPRWYWFEVV